MRRPAYLTVFALLLLAAADAAAQAKLPGQGAAACTVVSASSNPGWKSHTPGVSAASDGLVWFDRGYHHLPAARSA